MHERFVPYAASPGDDYRPEVSARRLRALLESGIEGQILSSTLTDGKSGQLHVLTLRAHCTENIARPSG